MEIGDDDLRLAELLDELRREDVSLCVVVAGIVGQ